MLHQKLAALETFGEFLADGLLDNPRTGETDQGAGLAMLRSPSMA